MVATPADGAAEALFDLASLLNQRDTMDASLIYARLALDLKPDFTLAELLVGEIREQQDRDADALEIYRGIGGDSPFSWTAQLRMALVLDALDRTDEATKQLETMAKDRPDRAEPLIELGDIERSHSKFTEAASAYDRGHGASITAAASPMSAPTSGRRPRPISSARSNCNRISRWCSTIWATPGSTRARISTKACR